MARVVQPENTQKAEGKRFARIVYQETPRKQKGRDWQENCMHQETPSNHRGRNLQGECTRKHPAIRGEEICKESAPGNTQQSEGKIFARMVHQETPSNQRGRDLQG